MQTLIKKVEISEDREHLYLYTIHARGCNCVHTILTGQALENKEGRKPILYNVSEDIPESLMIEVESDTDQLIALLKFLEIEMKDEYLLEEGTTEQIQKQIDNSTKNLAHQEHVISSEETDTDIRPTYK